jgi:hypothetical protein
MTSEWLMLRHGGMHLSRLNRSRRGIDDAALHDQGLPAAMHLTNDTALRAGSFDNRHHLSISPVARVFGCPPWPDARPMPAQADSSLQATTPDRHLDPDAHFGLFTTSIIQLQ